MWCRTIPAPKSSGIIPASRIRRISVLAQCYRLWSKVQCKHLMKFLCPVFPAGITGFVPKKGPYDATYELQWIKERATHEALDISEI